MSVCTDLKKFWIMPMVSLLVTGLAHGRTITVGQGAGYDYSEIQQAIFATKQGDTIVVAPGIYEEFIYFRGTNIVLTSTDPNDQSVVQNTVVTYTDGSVVRFDGQEGQSCVLQGLTVSGGEDNYGGGIRGRGTKATIRNCIINDNHANFGGGLHDCDGLIEGCWIHGSRAAYGGDCKSVTGRSAIASSQVTGQAKEAED